MTAKSKLEVWEVTSVGVDEGDSNFKHNTYNRLINNAEKCVIFTHIVGSTYRRG
jgi:hypothetical protein